MRDRVLAAVAAGVLLVMLVAGWAGLYAQPSVWRLVGLGLVAGLPVAVAAWSRGRWWIPAVVLAAVVVCATATGRSVFLLLVGSPHEWRGVVRTLADGLSDTSSATVPAVAPQNAAFISVLDVGFAALAAGVGWETLMRRRPVAAGLLVCLALAYRWTVLAPAHPVRTGALTLGGVLIAIVLAGGQVLRPGRAARGVTAAVLTAVLAGLWAPAVVAQNDGWWDWRGWSLGGGPRTSESLDLRQDYAPLSWPGDPKVVMRVQSSRRLPLRAAVLSEFDGLSFRVSQAQAGQALAIEAQGVVSVRPAPDVREVTVQRITFAGFHSAMVLTGGTPAALAGPFTGRAELLEGDTVQVDPPLGPGTSYTATVTLNDPTPQDLVGGIRYRGGEVAAQHAMPVLQPDTGGLPVRITLWDNGPGSADAASLGSYAAVRRLALRVAGNARSPYVAANRIEAYLRDETRFTYSEDPPQDDASLPPLVDFLINTHEGFCQHFAGAMAVMLRTLGIPARVAVGYTEGHLDPTTRTYTVLDRDAHSWVEAEMPGAGWVDFDPTPGRSAPDQASVSNGNYHAPASAAARPETKVTPKPVKPVIVPPTLAPKPVPPAATPRASGGAETPVWVWLAVALGVVGVALTGPGVAAAVARSRAQRTGDARARVLAAVRWMEQRLARLGVAPPQEADGPMRTAWLSEHAGLRAGTIYRLAAAARFAPETPTQAQATQAWREARAQVRAATRAAPRPRRITAYLLLPGPRRASLARTEPAGTPVRR